MATLAAAAAPVLAQTAERPDVQVGDEWRFVVANEGFTVTEPNRIWVIRALTAETIEATENGEPLTLTRELNLVDSPRQRESDARSLSFPLQVGKRWRYDTRWTFKPKGSEGARAGDVVVVAYEKVRVRAGEFDAFKLVDRGRLSGRSPAGSFYDAETTVTYWYAPSVRAIVRSDVHNPYLGRWSVELASYRLGR